MPPSDAERLREIRTFPSLVKYLRDELEWPIEADSFDEIMFDYEPEELGLDPKTAAKVRDIRQLRPLVTGQPWGVFFVSFEPKRLPIGVLRKILSNLAIKERQSAKKAHQQTWRINDLLFISSYGENEHRETTFAHFSEAGHGKRGMALKVVSWNERNTVQHLEHEHQTLVEKLHWPDDETSVEKWRKGWSSAFEFGYGEVIETARQLAQHLARLASAIRANVKDILAYETERGGMRKLMKAFREALIHDLSEDDFADTYAQTIAYGLLTEKLTSERSRKEIRIANPFLEEILDQCRKVGRRHHLMDFDELGVGEIEELLNSPQTKFDAIRRDFNDRNPQEDPVIHFYELFLKEYDPKKRTQRGVFYTPRPVVSYIVRSVDEILKKEFGLKDGLADTATWGEMAKRQKGLKIPDGTDHASPFVTILDPACGTGTFLIEVIDQIHRNLEEKWKREKHLPLEYPKLWNEYVPKHLLPRLFGFELMMAPYAIAHMKLGLKLQETEYKFGSDERARIYVTNSLEPPHDVAAEFAVTAPALAHEAKAVNKIKRDQRFTVVLGNPPYSNFGQMNKIPFILDLLCDYKQGLNEKKLNLDDDFIKFIRFSQHLVDHASAGVVGLITNHVYLDGITHRKMRQSLLKSFNRISILDLHGSAQKNERSLDGGAEENVFDIKQGVAIAVMAKAPRGTPWLQVSDLFGGREEKYSTLLKHISAWSDARSTQQAQAPNFFFRPMSSTTGDEYLEWCSLLKIMPLYNSGIQTKRDELTIHFRREDLESVLLDFRKHDEGWIRQRYSLGPDGRDWTVELAKKDVRLGGRIVQIQYRPFDYRFTYFTGNSKGFLAYPRRDVSELILSGSPALVTMRQISGVSDECEVFVSAVPMTDRSFASTLGTPYLFPLARTACEDGLLRGWQNLSEEFLKGISGRVGTLAKASPKVFLSYFYAILHSPTYRTRYAEFLKIDFPRIPLPGSLKLFEELATLGGELVSLHLMESKKLERHITRFVGKGDAEVAKGYPKYADETVWINSSQGFKGVPANVWEFHVGGYQVCLKWLKDRRGRTLSAEDIEHYQRVVVALHETIRLMPEIDKVIESHGGWPGAFATGKAAETTGKVEGASRAAEPGQRYTPSDEDGEGRF